MNEGAQAIAMWKLGFGDMNDELFPESKPERPKKRALKSDWSIHRMPRRSKAYLDVEIELSDEEFEKLAWGHIPQEMEDHWFMYFDGASFNFYRSWTGFCIYKAYVERTEDGFLIQKVTVNRKEDQYAETSDRRDELLVEILISQALGRDASILWEQFFEV